MVSCEINQRRQAAPIRELLANGMPVRLATTIQRLIKIARSDRGPLLSLPSDKQVLAREWTISLAPPSRQPRRASRRDRWPAAGTARSSADAARGARRAPAPHAPPRRALAIPIESP